MKRFLLLASIIGSLFASAESFATVNMPMVCSTAAVNAACPGDIWITGLGKAGLYIVVPGKGVIAWEDALATDLVRTCPSDVAPGVSCPVARISLAKSQVAQEAPQPTQWAVKFTWMPPTTRIDGSPLPAVEWIGYTLDWHPKIGGDNQTVSIGKVSTFTMIVPYIEICARLTTIGVGANSDPTDERCLSPSGTPLPIVAPKAASGLTMEQVPVQE